MGQKTRAYPVTVTVLLISYYSVSLGVVVSNNIHPSYREVVLTWAMQCLHWLSPEHIPIEL